tara:strand:- start:328 stop:660 length:333 start_codon:yes stop_codon:yes gene_type:complete
MAKPASSTPFSLDDAVLVPIITTNFYPTGQFSLNGPVSLLAIHKEHCPDALTHHFDSGCIDIDSDSNDPMLKTINDLIKEQKARVIVPGRLRYLHMADNMVGCIEGMAFD